MFENIAFAENSVQPSATFVFEEAFSRTLGWVTAGELQRLRTKKVAIAGLGGVGGTHATTLARLGIGKFRLAEFDHFELPNFNRQFGATVSNLFRPKAQVIAATLADINPEVEIDLWEKELEPADAASFLEGVDIYIDSIDFFALDMRRALFAEAYRQGIPAVTAAPIGTGAAWISFVPGGLTFERYFGFSEGRPEENYLKFLVGLAPKGLHRKYFIDPSRVDLENRKTPSTPMAINLCAGVAASEAMKLMLGRGGVKPAPWFHQFDVSAGRCVSGRSWFASKNPLRQIKLTVARKMVAAAKSSPERSEWVPRNLSEQVIDLARWAPSGDNEQPWRFENVRPEAFRVVLGPQDADNPYKFAKGRPMWLSGGALLEAISIAATRLNARAEITVSDTLSSDTFRAYDVVLASAPNQMPDPLSRFLEHRSVDRNGYKNRPLSTREYKVLADSLPEGWTLHLHQTFAEKWKASLLNSDATVLRMHLEQTYSVHKRAFRFDSDRPEVGLPMSSVPLDALSRRLLQWSLQSRERSATFNKMPAGARMASLQVDILPGLACAGHFLISGPDALEDTPEAAIAAGRGMLRFWLCAESLGLVLQPTFAPLNFAYAALSGSLDYNKAERRRALSLASGLKGLWQIDNLDRIVFVGRIGQPKSPYRPVRSLRKSTRELLNFSE